MSDRAVVDAHALIFWITGQRRRLGRAGRKLFEQADAQRCTLYFPALAIVEVLEAHHRGRIRLAGGADAWLSGLLASGSYFMVDLTREIVVAAQRLYGIPERGDRLIAATAVHMGLPLVTRDPAITAVGSVEHIW